MPQTGECPDCYAVIETGGKQYRVSEGDTLKIEKIEAQDSVTFDKVLMIHKGEKNIFGSPLLPSAKVTAEVVGNGKDKKILVFRQKPRKGFRKLRGHRQQFTTVKIKSIQAN
jgi:large subunit ribosomal protein L21